MPFHTFRHGVALAVATAGFAFACIPTAHAIVVYDLAGQNATPAPNNVDQYVGNVNGAGGGVLVAPDVVLTIDHITTGPTNDFTYNGTTYKSDSVLAIGGTHLMLLHLSGSTGQAGVQLYSDNGTAADATAPVTVVGYGGPKGTAFTGNSSPATQTGWNWTTGNGVASWGQVTNDNIYSDGSATYLGFAFTPTVGSAVYTGGDSGGGMFINDGGVMKLAGIAWSVDGYFSVGSGDPNRAPDVVAAIYDVPDSKIYTTDGHGNFILAADSQTGAPQHSYASRVSDSFTVLEADIEGLTSVPEPASLSLLAVGGLLMLRRRRA